MCKLYNLLKLSILEEDRGFEEIDGFRCELKKTPFFIKNRDFSHILLCAKFNRFFIILGGSQTAKNPSFWWFWGVWRGPIYWNFGQKITKNPDTSSAFFEGF